MKIKHRTNKLLLISRNKILITGCGYKHDYIVSKKVNKRRFSGFISQDKAFKICDHLKIHNFTKITGYPEIQKQFSNFNNSKLSINNKRDCNLFILILN